MPHVVGRIGGAYCGRVAIWPTRTRVHPSCTRTASKPPDTRDELLSVLTDRQRLVVELILEGLTHEEIGLLLGTAPDTVRRNLRNVRHRLDTRRGQYSATTPETNRATEPGEVV